MTSSWFSLSTLNQVFRTKYISRLLSYTPVSIKAAYTRDTRWPETTTLLGLMRYYMQSCHQVAARQPLGGRRLPLYWGFEKLYAVAPPTGCATATRWPSTATLLGLMINYMQSRHQVAARQPLDGRRLPLYWGFEKLYAVAPLSGCTTATRWPSTATLMGLMRNYMQSRHQVAARQPLWPNSGSPRQRLRHFRVAGPLQ